MGNGRRHYATTENPDIRDLRSVQRVGLRRTSQAEQFKRCVPVSGPRATQCIYAGMKDGPPQVTVNSSSYTTKPIRYGTRGRP